MYLQNKVGVYRKRGTINEWLRQSTTVVSIDRYTSHRFSQLSRSIAHVTFCAAPFPLTKRTSAAAAVDDVEEAGGGGDGGGSAVGCGGVGDAAGFGGVL